MFHAKNRNIVKGSWPSVRATGLEVIIEQMNAEPNSAVHCDPEISGGTPVFHGTRVPVQSLFDYLEGGETLDRFLDQFPSVSKEQAHAALDLARDFTVTRAMGRA